MRRSPDIAANIAANIVMGAVTALLALTFAVEPVFAAEQTRALNLAQEQGSLYLRVFGVTPPPYGHADFCRRDPRECAQATLEETRRAGTGEAFAELDRVNRQINAEIAPVTDTEQYGVEDYWTLPRSGKGDCEDYALLKRQRLMRAGWPPSALLMTVVFDEKREGHAVLTARTADGDFILDNKTNDIKLWSKTPYQFVMRQSYLDPIVWMSLDPKRAIPSVQVPVPVAGLHGTK
jgi:predicted transglutaminase-like cysteine proteinase